MTSFPILSNKEKKELIQLANEAADRAREAILPYFRKNIGVSNKDDMKGGASTLSEQGVQHPM